MLSTRRGECTLTSRLVEGLGFRVLSMVYQTVRLAYVQYLYRNWDIETWVTLWYNASNVKPCLLASISYTVDYTRMCLKMLKRHNMQVLTVLRICEHMNKASLQSPSPWSWGAVSIISRPPAAVAALTNLKLQRAAGGEHHPGTRWRCFCIPMYDLYSLGSVVWMFCSHLDLEHVWTYHAFHGAHFLPTRRFW